MQATQRAGDCIFVPWGYAHQVSSASSELSVAVSFLWERDVAYDPAACARAPTAMPLPLPLLLPLWWYSGAGVVPLGYNTLSQTRQRLLSAVEQTARRRRLLDAALFARWWRAKHERGGDLLTARRGASSWIVTPF